MDQTKESTVSRINLRLASLMIAGVWLAAGLCSLGLVMSLVQGEPRARLKPFTGVMVGANQIFVGPISLTCQRKRRNCQPPHLIKIWNLIWRRHN